MNWNDDYYVLSWICPATNMVISGGFTMLLHDLNQNRPWITDLPRGTMGVWNLL